MLDNSSSKSWNTEARSERGERQGGREREREKQGRSKRGREGGTSREGEDRGRGEKVMQSALKSLPQFDLKTYNFR